MGKFIKLFLGITFLFVLLVSLLIAGVLIYFDPNDHKDFIVQRVQQETGRSFAIDGSINLSFYPWLGIEATGITLGNAAGFGNQPFVHADKIALRIKTMPLLSEQYQLDTFRLHGLQLHLAKNSEGITNWDDLAAKGEKEDRKERAEPVQFAAVILGGVDIQDGSILWQDATTGQEIRVSELNVTTGELTYGAPINLAVAMKAEVANPDISSNLKMDGVLTYNLDDEIYAFKPIDLLATISGKDVPGGKTNLVFKAAMEADLGAETFNLSGLNLDVLGTSVQGDLVAQNIRSDKVTSQGQLTVKSDDLAPLFKLIDPESAEQIARLNDRSVDMKLKLESDMGAERVSLEQMDIKVLGSVIQGQVEANQVKGDHPAARGTLNASGPDLPALLQVAGQFQAGEGPGLKGYGQRLSKLSDKSFAVAVEFDANMADGNIRIPKFDVKTLGISANGNLDGKQLNTTKPGVDGKFVLKGEKLGGLLAALDKKELAEVLQSIDIDTQVSSKDSDIALSPLQFKAVLAGKQIPESPATVALNADTRINLEKQTVSMQNMTLKGMGLDVSGNLTASKIKTDTPAVDARLDARGRDLALLVKLAGMDDLARQLAGLQDRSFTFKSALSADMGKGEVAVSDLDAKLLGAVIQGNVNASNLQGEKPAARGILKATGPDLPALMQVLGLFQSGKEPVLVVYGKRLANVGNKAFDIAAAFDVDMDKGNIKVPTLSFNALDIRAGGQLTASNLTGNSGSLDGQFNLKSDKPAAVLAALGQPALAEVLQSISVDSAIKGKGGDYSLSPLQLNATFAGKQIPNSPVTMTLAANSRVNLDQQTLVVDNMSLDGLGLKLKTSLKAGKILEKPEFTGDLSLAEFNLRQFASQMNQELPVTADKNVFSKVAVTTAFAGSTDRIEMKDLAMTLDDTHLQGTLSVNKFTQPDTRFALNVDAINLDRYLPPEAQDKTITPATAAGSAATELPLDTLRALKMNGDLKIGQLVLSNARMSNVIISLKANEGDIRLEPLTADLYQGKYSGNVALNAKGKVPFLAVSTRLDNVQIEPLLKDYLREPESPAVGLANIRFDQLTATGSSTEQMKQSLAGNGEFNVSNGIVRGIDVRRALEQAEVMLESKQIPRVEKGGETHFEKLSGTMNIEQGVVKNKDLLMLSQGFTVRGKGTMANLKNNTIDYKLVASVDESSTTRGESDYNIGGYDVPVICKGKFEDISSACKPDLEELFKVAIQKGALEKLGETLGVPLPGADKKTTTQPTQQQPAEAPADQTTTTEKKKSPEDQLKDDVEGLIKGLFD